jgi:hypothetical protein
MSYPLEQLRQEVAYIAYYLHWSYEEIMNFTHHERSIWVKELASINRLLNKGDDDDGEF